MAGNVWQWTSDWYRPDYYRELASMGGVAPNPQGPQLRSILLSPAKPKRFIAGALVERQDETIMWKAFGYENTYEDKILFDPYSTVGPLTFDATAYERALVQAMDLLRRANSR